jgi:hypothetical protein
LPALNTNGATNGIADGRVNSFAEWSVLLSKGYPGRCARRLIEIDISSSYLTIFYALCDQQLDDSTQDAYAGILGATALDREVAKFWINASFGNRQLLTKWSKDLVEDLQKKASEESSVRLRRETLSDENDQREGFGTAPVTRALGATRLEAAFAIGATLCSLRVRR